MKCQTCHKKHSIKGGTVCLDCFNKFISPLKNEIKEAKKK